MCAKTILFNHAKASRIARIGLGALILVLSALGLQAQAPQPTVPAVSTTCDYPFAPANVSVNVAPSPDAATTLYFLAHMINGEIIDTSSVDASFNNVAVGQYFIVAAHSDGLLFNVEIGQPIYDVYNSKNCLTWSDAVAVQVCSEICDFRTPEDVTLAVEAVPTGQTAVYLLVASDNTIAYTSATPSFSGVAENTYFWVTVHHDGSATGLNVGDTLYDALTDANNCIKGSNVLSINVCESCAAGIVAPPVSPTTLANDCSNNEGSVDLKPLHTGTVPAGTSVVWSMEADARYGLTMVVDDPAAVTISGTYYAYYWEDMDPIGIHNSADCYSPASDAVTVTVDLYSDNCDFDKDGINNDIDIDDDNDGVLDIDEIASCVSPDVDKSTVTITTDMTWSNVTTLPAILLDGNNTNGPWANPDGQDLTNQVYLAFDLGSPYIVDTFEIACNVNDIFDVGAVLKMQGSTDNTAWDDLVTITTVDADGNTGLISGAANAHNFEMPTNTTAYQYYRVYGVSGTTNNWYINEVYFSSGFSLFCDTDGDGYSNQFDLDSDKDGCSDALESGATTDTTTDFAFTGTVSANGLDDSLEGSGDDGIINYTSTYAANALDDQIATCPACDAGTDAPLFNTYAIPNICPATTADLTAILATNTPATGTIALEWHTIASPVDNSTLYASASAPIAGTYYAVFHDTVNDCYSPGSAGVVVTIIACDDCAAGNAAPPLALPSGN